MFDLRILLSHLLLSVPSSRNGPPSVVSFVSISTTPCEVYDVLKSLKVRKACGLDGLTPGLLRFCAVGVASSLAVLFNRSFSDGVFPTAWKSALVIPVFKKGVRSNSGNYRPIALLSIVSKAMERIVYAKLRSFLGPWLNINQSGFRKRDCTVPQLIRLCQQWSEAVDSSHYVGVVFFDLKKAFDRVWHRGLLVNYVPLVSVSQLMPGSAVFLLIDNRLPWLMAVYLPSPVCVLVYPRELS